MVGGLFLSLEECIRNGRFLRAAAETPFCVIWNKIKELAENMREYKKVWHVTQDVMR